MAILEWTKKSDLEWAIDARYDGETRVSPRWLIWLSNDLNWYVAIDGTDLLSFACDSDDDAKRIAQMLEDVREKAVAWRELSDESLEVQVLDAVTLARLHEWNLVTFGPGTRTAATIAHIRSELGEIEADPKDATEWSDVIILALNGALREGFAPQEILDAIKGKLAENETRSWPDWREVPEGTPIEHVERGV